MIDFGFGNPDLPSPDIAVEKLAEAARNPKNHRYSASRGIPNLRLAIANRYKLLFDVDIDPDTEVVTTIGAKEGLTHLMWVLLGPGDSAIVPSPELSDSFGGAPASRARTSSPCPWWTRVRARTIRVTTSSTVCLLRGRTQSSSRASSLSRSRIIRPARVLTRIHGATRRVRARARRGDLSRLAYADLGFDGYRPPSILEVPRAKECCVELYTLTKSFSMAGWRVGFLVGNPEIVAALTKLKSYLDYGHVPAGPDRRHCGDERSAGLSEPAARDLSVSS